MADDEPDWVERVVAGIYETLTARQFDEFYRLLHELVADNPSIRLFPQDILALVGTAMYNLGDLSQEQAEEIMRDARNG